MEPVTHFLTGACIGRAGFNRKTAYATLAAVLAAEAADLDVVWGFAGPVDGLKHHRGITHTFWAAPVVAGAAVGAVWLLDRVLRARRGRVDGATSFSSSSSGDEKDGSRRQSIRWGWLYLTACVAALSHLLLDWTNNYGLRPFFPFNPRWYSGDLVFIAEPVIWALLLAALIFPALLGLTDREVGARRTRFPGRNWAIAALSGMVILWCFRWAEHASARNLAEAANITATPVSRIALEPYPINPWRWHAILETGTTWQTAEVDTRTGQVASDPRTDSIFKPQPSPAIEAAKRTRLGQVYLDWSQWPVVRDIGQQAVPGNPDPNFPPLRPWTTIEFSDLRFAYSWRDTHMVVSSNQQLDQTLARAGLSGYVYIVDGREDAGQFMGGREQK